MLDERTCEKVVWGVDWPYHWLDPVHEEDDGGCDLHGSRPQQGIEILRGELDALIFKDGISTAKDDVTGADLVPKLVRKARAEEMTYFKKMIVYEIVPEDDQVRTGGKIVGTRWVDVNKRTLSVQSAGHDLSAASLMSDGMTLCMRRCPHWKPYGLS